LKPDHSSHFAQLELWRGEFTPLPEISTLLFLLDKAASNNNVRHF
jgi:hypothetical protein